MDTIISAIENKKVLQFSYHGTQRTVEPHLCGYNTNGKLTLSAWQLTGTGEGWRDFVIPEISNPAETGATFSATRPGYNKNDSTMSRILARV
ncbi:WYL domain-containing protein [Agrobacterium vitis]|uniref:WYL domain-containing protein n=1 Tax=Agrobacterium vitis TaxID=373 RepID=UPI003D288269